MKFFWACVFIRLKDNYSALLLSTAAIIVVSLAAACTSHPQGPPPKGVLKENRLVDLLVDMHYFESVYSVTGHISGFRPDRGPDSLDFYQPVLDMHGIGREEFVETMRYYSFNPPQFEALYNYVIDEINRRHTMAQMARSDAPEPIEEYAARPAQQENLWTLAEDWVFPGADTNKMISFEIPVFEPGTYTFSADIKLDPEDYSENPAVDIWFYHDDGTETVHRERFGRVTIIKDGRSRHVTVTGVLTHAFITHIRGRVLDMSNPEEDGERHAEVRNISLTRTASRGLIRD